MNKLICFSRNSMSSQLASMYEKYFPGFIENIWDKVLDVSMPLLLQPDQQYVNAKKRIWFLGQEPSPPYMCNEYVVWKEQGLDNKKIIDNLMSMYRKNATASNSFQDRKTRGSLLDRIANMGYNNSGFWHFSKQLMTRLQQEGYGLLINDIVKWSRRCNVTGTDWKVYSTAMKYFPVIKEEVKICKPDFLVFVGSLDEYSRAFKDVFGTYKKVDELDFNGWGTDIYEFSSGIKMLKLKYHPCFKKKGWNSFENLDLQVEGIIRYLSTL